MHNDFKMLFGKYKDRPLIDIPVEYLDWLIGQGFPSKQLKGKITEHLQTRPEWHQLGDE